MRKACLKRSLHWSSSSVFGEETWVDVHCAVFGNVQEFLRQKLPICCCDAQIWLNSLQSVNEIFLQQIVVFQSRQQS